MTRRYQSQIIMADQERSNKRRKKSNVVKRRKGGQDILIDQDDFKVIKAIKFRNKEWKAKYLKYEVEGVEKRVSWIDIQGILLDNETIDKILSLSALKKLVFRDCLLDSLPPSIGLLQNLEEFELHCCSIHHIPTEIGDLVNLKALSLSDTRIQWEHLPASIGNLKKLEYLVLEDSDIGELPEEIWNLTSLRSLNISPMPINIPSSIKRLKDLEILNIGTIEGNLPEEIGTLTKLKELYIEKHLGTIQLPASMVNLKELYHFELNVESFDYRQLEFIKSLPKIGGVYVRAHEPWQSPEILPDLIQDTPTLVDVDFMMEHERPKVIYALSCNRFKSRNPFGSSSPLIKKMWPRMLSNASRAFYTFGGHRPFYNIGVHDAVYKLLADGGGSFLEVLLDRSKNIGGDADESCN